MIPLETNNFNHMKYNINHFRAIYPEKVIKNARIKPSIFSMYSNQ